MRCRPHHARVLPVVSVFSARASVFQGHRKGLGPWFFTKAGPSAPGQYRCHICERQNFWGVQMLKDHRETKKHGPKERWVKTMAPEEVAREIERYGIRKFSPAWS